MKSITYHHNYNPMKEKSQKLFEHIFQIIPKQFMSTAHITPAQFIIT